MIKKDILLKISKVEKNSKWILMDYGDIIVHLFDTEERKITGLKNCGLINPLFRLRIFYNVL